MWSNPKLNPYDGIAYHLYTWALGVSFYSVVTNALREYYLQATVMLKLLNTT